MKLFVVGLIHRDDIVLSFEYLDLQKQFSAYMYIVVKQLIWILSIYFSEKTCVDLICQLRSTPDKVALPGDRHKGHGVIVHLHRLVSVRVPEYHVWYPEASHLDTALFGLNLYTSVYLHI